MEDHQGAETKHLKGNSLQSGQDRCREETGTAGEQRGRKETDKPTKMETPSSAGGGKTGSKWVLGCFDIDH